jgi:hypothetical protein
VTVTQDQRSTWLQKLDAECPYQIVLPRRQLMDDSAIKDFLCHTLVSSTCTLLGSKRDRKIAASMGSVKQ